MYIKGAIMVPHPPLIIPAIGKGQEADIAETISGYRKAAQGIRQMKPETIIVVSPHTTMYADYFHISPSSSAHGDFGRFGVPQVSFEAVYDTEMTEELSRICEEKGIRAGILGQRTAELDHGTMVPLHFINEQYEDYKLVRVGLSGLPLTDHYALGAAIKAAAEKLEKQTVIVASGDLSHCLKADGPYGYKEEGPLYDAKIMEVMEGGDFGKLFDFSDEFRAEAGECGHGSFAIMAGALDRTAVKVKRLSYEGTFGVGYGICIYETAGEDQTRNFGEQYAKSEEERLEKQQAAEDAYVRLARASAEYFVKHGRPLAMPENLPCEITESRAGVFVSIKKQGRLRGCIGTIVPVRESIAAEILENAVSAVSRDPRFDPVQQWELAQLEYSVDVLGETEAIQSEEQLDVKRYGVIVSAGPRRGLLLPNLEGVHSVQQQIKIAKEKAGIQPEQPVQLERFEVVRHK